MKAYVVRRMSYAGVTTALLLISCDRGGTDRIPPSIRYADHVSAGGNLPPAGELKNPLAVDSTNVDDGGKIFSAMNCDGCHGGGATGWVGPSLVDGRWRYGGSDGAVYQSIFYGRPKGMPAYGGAMSPGAIWKVIAYIRAQPVPSVVPTQRWPSGETVPRPAREQNP